MTRETMITLYGNVGADPRTFHFPGKEGIGTYYDPIVDEVVERPYTTKDKELVTFSIAINKWVREGKGKKAREKKITRWVQCDDWKGLAQALMVRKGDRVMVRGTMRERTYEKDGETRTAKNLVVHELRVEKRNIRDRTTEATEQAQVPNAA